MDIQWTLQGFLWHRISLGGEVNTKFFHLAAWNVLRHIRNGNRSKKLLLVGWNPPVPGVWRYAGFSPVEMYWSEFESTISRKLLIVWRSLTPQNDRKTHFSISVSYIILPSNDWKCPKMHKMCQNGVKRPKWGVESNISRTTSSRNLVDPSL